MKIWGTGTIFCVKTPDELGLLGDIPLALDVGHAHQNHCLKEFLTFPAGHYHIHDNNSKEDSHVAVGEGTIDFGPVMKAVRKSRITPVIEVATFEGVLKSIDASLKTQTMNFPVALQHHLFFKAMDILLYFRNVLYRILTT